MMIESPRLLLREWRPEDASALADGLNDLAVSRWLMAVPYPYALEDAQGFLRYCLRQAEETPRTDYFFAIVLKAADEVVGGTSLNGIEPHNGTASGGIWLQARHHGHGYGTEAFDARARFAFETLGLRRLENGFFTGNEASRRMQERLGYVVEGMRRKGYLCRADGLLKDEYVTGLLKEEWRPYTYKGENA